MTEYRWRRRRRPYALFLPPPVLHQRYTLDREIGHGGCARVYRAWDTHQGQPVALKRAHLSHKHCEALFYEAEILTMLHHPAIPAFVEYFEEEGRSYLVETWMEGMPIKHLRFFEVQQILWIGRQCCDVLEYLHQQHLVHRDITPDNILLNAERKTLSLLDFGLARLHMSSPYLPDAPRTLSLAAGTYGYVAPEQWSEGTISPAADIYSLGMVLGCALTACEPEEVLAVQSFPRLWDHPRDIPPEILPLLALLDRMIDRRLEKRPALAEVSSTLSELEDHLFRTS